jgi:hypothetical protein
MPVLLRPFILYELFWKLIRNVKMQRKDRYDVDLDDVAEFVSKQKNAEPRRNLYREPTPLEIIIPFAAVIALVILFIYALMIFGTDGSTVS